MLAGRQGAGRRPCLGKVSPHPLYLSFDSQTVSMFTVWKAIMTNHKTHECTMFQVVIGSFSLAFCLVHKKSSGCNASLLNMYCSNSFNSRITEHSLSKKTMPCVSGVRRKECDKCTGDLHRRVGLGRQDSQSRLDTA